MEGEGPRRHDAVVGFEGAAGHGGGTRHKEDRGAAAWRGRGPGVYLVRPGTVSSSMPSSAAREAKAATSPTGTKLDRTLRTRLSMSPIGLMLAPLRSALWAFRTAFTASSRSSAMVSLTVRVQTELRGAAARMTRKTLDSVTPLAMNRGTCGGRPYVAQSATNRSKTLASS